MIDDWLLPGTVSRRKLVTPPADLLPVPGASAGGGSCVGSFPPVCNDIDEAAQSRVFLNYNFRGIAC